ncbi:MAG: glycosyltransferase [Vicinamibacterales bacterium]
MLEEPSLSRDDVTLRLGTGIIPTDQMSKPVILVIAYYFPPDNEIGAARPARFVKYLRRQGYTCRVVTAARQPPGGFDGNVCYAADPHVERPGLGWTWQAERISRKFLIKSRPVLGWMRAALAHARRILSEPGCEDAILLSTSPPVGTHMLAARLAKEFGLRWVADFRDPVYGPSFERATLEHWVAPALERRILQRASLVLANTDAMQAMWQSQLRRFACFGTVSTPRTSSSRRSFQTERGEFGATSASSTGAG